MLPGTEVCKAVRAAYETDHQKIKRVFICRLIQHYMKYKALYDIKYIIKLSARVMLFKAHLTYLFFLSDIFMFLKEHIF